MGARATCWIRVCGVAAAFGLFVLAVIVEFDTVNGAWLYFVGLGVKLKYNTKLN